MVCWVLCRGTDSYFVPCACPQSHVGRLERRLAVAQIGHDQDRSAVHHISGSRCAAIVAPSVAVTDLPIVRLPAVNKLTDTRTSLHKDVKLALHGLADQQQAFAVSCSTSISSALSELETLKTRHASEETRVETLNSELRRIRRLMVEHHEAEAEAEGATVAA